MQIHVTGKTNQTTYKDNAGGGMGGKITPSAVLVIQNGNTKAVNIKNQDGITKILDMVPDLVNRFSKDKDNEIDFSDIQEDEKSEEMPA